uniref:Putative cyclin-dependent kinase inhibitor n=1 Tax=Culex tarsalis TaxID=7177 RepID=A0A1Q3FFD1_CULTA
MSAKVYNPMILSEISTLRSPAIGRRPASAARITAARVKRDLFGPVDKEDSKKFIERELAAQNDVLSKKWGFDFRSGEPLQNHEQYQWERVPPTSAPSCFVGGMVALTRAAHVVGTATASEDLMDQRAERENGSCFSTTTTAAPAGSDAEMDAPVMTHPLAKISLSSSSSSSSFPASATRARRQQRITDYLKERKRLSSSAPKVALAKRARQMLSGSPTPSSSSSSSSQSSQ